MHLIKCFYFYHKIQFHLYTSLGTQRCQGYLNCYSYRFPALKLFYRETKFSLVKLNRPLNLESQNQTKNIPVGLPSSQIKIWRQLVQGFLNFDRTNKQTDKKQRYQRFSLQYLRITKFEFVVKTKILSMVLLSTL